MTLSAENLQAVLDRALRYFDAIDSTNDEALAWLRDGADAGSVVIADEQRKGRGRKGRLWYTPPNVAIAMSLILQPDISETHRISMMGALAVAELCEYLGIEGVGIKWPNDVQINGKKVCGVLPEAAWENQTLRGVVLGMGVNVRVDFNPQIASLATNLADETANSVDRVACIAYLLQRLDHWRQRLSSDALFQAWSTRLNTLHQQVKIGERVGIAQRVDESGALWLQMPDGSIQRVMAGDVSLVPPQP